MNETITAAGFVNGQIDTLLLKVISVRDCYGYSIYKTLSEITGQAYKIKEATLYSGLRRLEAERLVASYWGDETQGGRRKYYTITEQGLNCLNKNISRWEKTKEIMDSIIKWKGDYDERYPH